MNNEEIEIVYLSEEPEKENKEKTKKKINIDFKKIKKPLIIGSSSLIAIILLFTVFIFLFGKKETVLQNVIGEKTKIETALDLKGIFNNDKLKYETYGITNENKAVINGNKIYYSYSPNYCVYDNIITCEELDELIEECEKNRKLTCSTNSKDEKCQENYCSSIYSDKSCIEENENNTSNINLCNNYYKDDTNYEDLITRYLLVSNLEGTTTNELRKHEGNEPINIVYSDKNIALYYSIKENASFKIDYTNDKVIKIKDGFNILPSPVSNEKETVFIEEKDSLYTLNYFDYNNYIKPTKQENFYNDPKEDNNIRIDKYDNNALYTISNSLYDNTLSNGYNGVYKNGKIIYQFKNDYEDFFIGQNHIYILTTNGYNLRLLKINKETKNEEASTIILKQNKKMDEVKYITTSIDHTVYINIDNSVYTFNELDDTLTKTELAYHKILSSNTYNNYIYFYVTTRENNDYYDLVLYNTVTKEVETIEKVEYFTISDNYLYTVENNEDTFELYKREIY